MAFKVSYRGESGAQESIIIDAATRPQLFAELQKRGISAIRVEETYCKPKKAKPAPSTPSPRKPSPFRGLFAGLIVIALAVAAWFYLLPTLEEIKETARKLASKTIAEPSSQEKGEPVLPSTTPAVSDKYTRHGKSFAEVAEEARSAAAPEMDVVVIGSTNRTFSSGLEQTLCNIFSIDVGDMPPPLPRIPDIELDSVPDILARMCQVDESDSDLIKDRKESVNIAKAEMLKYLEEGGDFDDFLEHYHGILKKAFFRQKECQRQVYAVCGEEEPEVALKFFKTINEELLQDGIKPVELPDDFAESLGLNEYGEAKEGENQE